MYATTKDFAKITKPANLAETKKPKLDKEKENEDTCDEDSIDDTTSRETKSMPSRENTSQPIGPQKSFDLAQPTKNVQNEDEPIGEFDKEDKDDRLAQKSTESSDEEEIAISDPQYHAKQIARTFKARCRKQAKQMMSKMIVSDKVAFKDPQNLSEFTASIYRNMLREENEHLITPADYLKTVQTEIKDTQRAFLLEWIIDVHRKFKLQPECLYVCQHIIDTYLSKKQIKNSMLHLLGVTTLLIATKYEEIYPPELRDLLAVSENKFTRT